MSVLTSIGGGDDSIVFAYDGRLKLFAERLIFGGEVVEVVEVDSDGIPQSPFGFS